MSYKNFLINYFLKNKTAFISYYFVQIRRHINCEVSAKNWFQDPTCLHAYGDTQFIIKVILFCSEMELP